MTDAAIKAFKISIPDSELDLLRRKLELTRLPRHNFNWTEENGIDTAFLQKILDFWLSSYSWRDEEAKINQSLPQFITKIKVEGGDNTSQRNEGEELDVHFVHSLATGKGFTSSKGGDIVEPIPLLFVHGWPGSFLEVSKGLTRLNELGFHVVAPSLPGYGFSSYVPNRGFDLRDHGRVLDSLMAKLGYGEYVVQGGDWGSGVVRAMSSLFPHRVKAVHVNMFFTPEFDIANPHPQLTPHEARLLDRTKNYFMKRNSAYSQMQAQRPMTLGHAMHDSPLGLLSYIADKLITWSDSYPWTPTELITWTLMHYFPGPTTSFAMYHENNQSAAIVDDSWVAAYVGTPLGVSSFAKEIIMMPRAWGEKVANVKFYREHEEGGHFAMWEKPELLVADIVEFVRLVWTT